MDEILKDARGSSREREWSARYRIARTASEAFTACEDVRLWLEELAQMAHLGFDGEHCVCEALKDLRAVHGYLLQAARSGR